MSEAVNVLGLVRAELRHTLVSHLEPVPPKRRIGFNSDEDEQGSATE